LLGQLIHHAVEARLVLLPVPKLVPAKLDDPATHFLILLDDVRELLHDELLDLLSFHK